MPIICPYLQPDHVHVVLASPHGSRAVLKALRCFGNTNNSEYLLPKLSEWNRFSWDQLTRTEGCLVSTHTNVPVTGWYPGKCFLPTGLALALLLCCVFALKKITMAPEYLAKVDIIS